MAKDDEHPQFNPRHRIAGAIILVSLAVIFIPMLLDESEPPTENQSLTQIPPRDSLAAETKVVVTPVTPAGETADTTPIVVADNQPAEPVSTPAPTATTQTETASPAQEVDTRPAPVVASTEKKTVASAKPVAAKPSDVEESISKGWMVQVGTFANANNADRLRDKLKNLGYTVRTESITVQGSKAMRLRVGPYRDKTDASKAQVRLQKELNIKGIVLAP